MIDGNLALGDLVAFNLYIVMLILPLRLTGQLIAQAARATGAAGRIYEVLATDPLITDPAHRTPLPVDGKGELRFEGVDFRYGDGPVVLEGLDLVLRPGEAVALVGPTASGKTTVARLIPRFYDVNEGRVLLDGVDVRNLDLSDIRSAVGIVFEDTFLFSDSVRENIAFANPEAHLDQVRRGRARGSRRLHRVVARRLRDGDRRTRLLAVGRAASAHRHRACGARRPRVLILDDATSSVDPTKEHEIRAALREVMAGRTTIIIAHRPATIALADRVVLLDHGRAVEEGTHEELLQRSVLYRSVLAQSTHADDVAAEAAVAAAAEATEAAVAAAPAAEHA